MLIRKLYFDFCFHALHIDSTREYLLLQGKNAYIMQNSPFEDFLLHTVQKNVCCRMQEKAKLVGCKLIAGGSVNR